MPTIVLDADFQADPFATYFDYLRAQDNVQSLWRMSDAGSTLADYFAVNNGTRVGSPTLVSGPYSFDSDQASRFNGTSQYATVPNSPSLNQAGTFEISGWIRPQATPGAKRKIAGIGTSWYIELDTSRKVVFTVHNEQAGVTTNTVLTSNTVLSVNSWYHVHCIHNADTDVVSLYINGKLEASASHTVGVELWSNLLYFAGWKGTTAPSQRGSVTGPTSNGGTANTVVTKPTGVVDGDLCLVFLEHVNNTNQPTAVPTGFQLLGSVANGTGGTGKIWCYWKIASGEPSTWTFTFGDTTAALGTAVAYSGVDQANPFATPLYTATTANTASSNISYGSPTPPYDAVMALAYYRAPVSVVSWNVNRGTEILDTTTIGLTQESLSTPTGWNFTATASGGSTREKAEFVLFINGTGNTFTQVDLKDWTYRSKASSADEVAINYATLTAGFGTMTDLSARVVKFESKIGRQYERDTVETGQFTFTVNNKDRALDPSNASGTYAPNVRVQRRIRARLNHNSSNYPLMEGYVESYNSKWVSHAYDEMPIVASDASEYLGRAGITGTVGGGLSGAQINRVLDLASWPLSKRNIDTGAYSMVGFTVDASNGDLAGAFLKAIAESEEGIFFIDADGTATFHDRNHRFTSSRSLTSQAVLKDEDVNDGSLFYTAADPDFSTTQLFNDMIVSPADTALGGTPQRVIDAQSLVDYRWRTDKKDTRLDSNNSALEIARARLNRTVEPLYRFTSLKINPYSTASWTTCLSLKVSDRVTVIRNPQWTGTQINVDCFIEGIKWSLDAGGEWAMTLQVSPVSSFQYVRSHLRAGPVSYYKMIVNTSLVDEMQINYGTLTGSPSLVTGGLTHDTQQALSFVQGTSSGTIPDSPSISLPVGSSGGMGISMMLRTPASAPGSRQSIILKTGSYEVALRTDMKLEFVLTNGGNTVTVVSTTALSTSTWYNLFFVYNNAYSGTPQFGHTSAGATMISFPPEYRAGSSTGENNAQVDRFQILEEGTITNIYLDLKVEAGAPYAQDVAAVAYADSGGAPGALLGQAAGQRITSLTRQFYAFPVSIPVPAGFVWLGGVSGVEYASDPTVLDLGVDNSGGTRRAKNMSVAPDGSHMINSNADDPFGTPALSDTKTIAVYAAYTPTKRTGAEGRAIIYINGVQDNFGAYTGGVADTANNVSIGGTMQMQDLGFWNRIVGPVEVAELNAAR